jgi:beta-glucosidase
MPVRIEDIPGWHSYPGEHGRHLYSEGIFVGYRYYDLKKVVPAFPFGHGLSYTAFAYEDLAIDTTEISPGSSCSVTLTIRNTGPMPGKEIVQIYVQPVVPGLKRPIRELKAFAKIALQPGECKSVSLCLAPRDFQYFDPSRGSWVLQAEAFVIEAAASSRDIRLSQLVPCRSEPLRPPVFTAHTPTSTILADAGATETVRAFIAEKLSLSADEARNITEKVRGSFLGFHESLSWFIGDSISNEDVAQLLYDLNNESRGPAAGSELGSQVR